MIDRDALAREFAKVQVEWSRWGDLTDSDRGDFLEMASIALRHIESARAEERERCAMICRGWLNAFGWQEIEFVSARTWATDSIADIEDAIRAGSPAPAAPDVCAEMKAALTRLLADWDKFTRYGSPIAKASNEAVNQARAALEAASREGK